MQREENEFGKKQSEEVLSPFLFSLDRCSHSSDSVISLFGAKEKEVFLPPSRAFRRQSLEAPQACGSHSRALAAR